jgi:hypothetical protein
MTFSTLLRQDPATLPYRIYFFFNVGTVTTKEREFIQTHLQKNGNWLVFIRPTGVSNPDAENPFDLVNSTALHGIALAPKKGDRKENVMSLIEGAPLPDLAAGSELADPADDIGGSSGSDTGLQPIPRPTAWTAVNDPAGKWTVEVRSQLTGELATLPVEVGAAAAATYATALSEPVVVRNRETIEAMPPKEFRCCPWTGLGCGAGRGAGGGLPVEHPQHTLFQKILPLAPFLFILHVASGNGHVPAPSLPRHLGPSGL